jgi:hypothetical protein
MKEEIKLDELKLKHLKYKIFYYQMCLEEKPELSINYIKKEILWKK